MSYSVDEIHQINMDREERHLGEEHGCDQCGEGGVVGGNLVSGSSDPRISPVLRSMFGGKPAKCYWIHESCAPERAPLRIAPRDDRDDA